MEKLKCDAYYDENKNNRTEPAIKSKFENVKFLINLIEYIKKEIPNKPIQLQPSQKAKPKKKEILTRKNHNV